MRPSSSTFSNVYISKANQTSMRCITGKDLLFIWVLRPVIIISLIRQVNRKVLRKREIPEKNYVTTRKQNFACLTCDPS